MIEYTTGNILESKTTAVVNTVNCEGFMGKGIAYQFKLKYPENNEEYTKLCRNNEFHIGDIFLHNEDGKIILNFPTKDKWRKKSQYDFIEKGLETLKEKLQIGNIDSVSIPPLGCGNGGLKWEKVKLLIEDYLSELSSNKQILVYEPLYNSNQNFKKTIKKAPKLSSSHILLMRFKMNLNKFNKTRLQKSAYLNNIISGQDYFKFQGQNFGPYAHSIEILSKEIKEYQNYYNISTQEAYEKAFQVLISKNLNSKIDNFNDSLNKTIKIVNSTQKDSDLELITTILFLIDKFGELPEERIVEEFHNWNKHKRENFTLSRIEDGLEHLMRLGLIKKTLYNKFELANTTHNNVYRK
jgi:O-acetyl-ADP-ribose deacetylase (regulator of RNase III)